jgi:ribosomal protein L37AE/L43A
MAKPAVQFSLSLSLFVHRLPDISLAYNPLQLRPKVGNILILSRFKMAMKVHCPDCKGTAELADDFSFVKCSNCSFDMTYGEYVKYIAYKDSRYRDILSDYK